ncbi:hypothetical protein QUA86_19815 [Microcoleus sp. F6_B6]
MKPFNYRAGERVTFLFEIQDSSLDWHWIHSETIQEKHQRSSVCVCLLFIGGQFIDRRLMQCKSCGVNLKSKID